jgi:uncharacterized membrane protein
MLYSGGLIFILVGLIFKVFPPHKINYIYGYRTKLSMKNQDTWDEAQKYSANSLIILGFIYVVTGFVISQLVKNISTDYELIIFLIGAVVMIAIDEGHLRKVYNTGGIRKL